MVRLTSVCKQYPGQPKVLDHVNLELKRGDFLYVLGGTGAGKSTLLRLLATEESPTVGALSLFGYEIGKMGPTTLRGIRRLLGYVPQDIRLIRDLTVLENVTMSLSLAGSRALRAEARGKVSEVLEKLGLAAKQGELARNLSGGEAQRVALARALVRSPEIIIADEPTGAQDRDHTWAMMDLLVRANLGGATVVVATHDREIVRRVRKRCAILRGGRLSLEEAYGSMVAGVSGAQL